MSTTDLPTLNAILNGITTCLLLLGFLAIKNGQEDRHKLYMLLACGFSALFLIGYSIYHVNVGSVPFQGVGTIRVIYFAILIPHIILAAVQVPLILIAVYKAFCGERESHRKMVKWAYPIWLFVSVTGVLVYIMLYHMDFSQ
ncbi:MAG: DUF420 domain-containing protein [SAR324 cluster bacterium]|nr:DUF420 domain-containing protein [SAR324 cluster bacterium]